jgi:hypothetical protein
VPGISLKHGGTYGSVTDTPYESESVLQALVRSILRCSLMRTRAKGGFSSSAERRESAIKRTPGGVGSLDRFL